MQHQNIIKKWANTSDLARQISVNPVTVHAWKQRNRVPVKYWQKIAAAAAASNIELSITDFLDEVS